AVRPSAGAVHHHGGVIWPGACIEAPARAVAGKAVDPRAFQERHAETFRLPLEGERSAIRNGRTVAPAHDGAHAMVGDRRNDLPQLAAIDELLMGEAEPVELGDARPQGIEFALRLGDLDLAV